MLRSYSIAPRRGVTLLELLVVCALIGIVTAMALPRLDYQRWRQDAAIRVVQGTLRQAQRTAIQRQHDVIVSFDVGGGRVRYIEDQDGDMAMDAGELLRWRPLEEGTRFVTPPAGLFGSVSSPLVGSNVPTVDGMPSLVFHRSGSASGALEIYLGSGTGRDGDTRALSVTHSTGRVDWFRYVDSTWKRGGN